MMADKSKGTGGPGDALVQKHRLINSYVDSYKLKLCLKEGQDPLEAFKSKENTTTLTIDFNELQRMALAS